MARKEDITPIDFESVAIRSSSSVSKTLPHQEFAKDWSIVSGIDHTTPRTIEDIKCLDSELVLHHKTLDDRVNPELQKTLDYDHAKSDKRKEASHNKAILDLNSETMLMIRPVFGDSDRVWIHNYEFGAKNELIVNAETVTPSYKDRIMAVKRANGGTYYYQAEERKTKKGDTQTVWKLRSKRDLTDKIVSSFQIFENNFQQGIETYLSQLELSSRECIPMDGVTLEIHKLTEEAGFEDKDAGIVKMIPTLFDRSRKGRIVPSSLRLEVYGNRIGYVSYGDNDKPKNWSRVVDGKTIDSTREEILGELKKILKYREIDKYVY